MAEINKITSWLTSTSTSLSSALDTVLGKSTSSSLEQTMQRAAARQNALVDRKRAKSELEAALVKNLGKRQVLDLLLEGPTGRNKLSVAMARLAAAERERAKRERLRQRIAVYEILTGETAASKNLKELLARRPKH